MSHIAIYCNLTKAVITLHYKGCIEKCSVHDESIFVIKYGSSCARSQFQVNIFATHSSLTASTNYYLKVLYSYSFVSYCCTNVSKILENSEGRGSVYVMYWGKTRVACFGYLMIPDKWNNSAVRYAR